MIPDLVSQLVYKKGHKTTEFWVTIVGGLLSGGVALGVIDLSPESISSISSSVVDGANEIVERSANGDSVMEILLRIVALIIGGQMVSNYVKSRGETKGAQRLELVREIIAELQKTEALQRKSSHDENSQRPDEPFITL